MFVVGCADDYVKGPDEYLVAIKASNEHNEGADEYVVRSHN